MNTWNIQDMTFSYLGGYGPHNHLDFKNIPNRQIIGIHTVNAKHQTDIFNIMLHILSSAYIYVNVDSSIKSTINICRGALTLQKENRLFRIKRTIFIKRIPGKKSKIRIATIYYEIMGQEIRLLNGQDEDETERKIRSQFTGSQFDPEYEMAEHAVWPDEYYRSLPHGQILERHAINRYDLENAIASRSSDIAHLLNDIDPQLRVARDQILLTREEWTKKVNDIKNDTNAHLAVLSDRLNLSIPFLEMTGERYYDGLLVKTVFADTDIVLEDSICARIVIDVALTIAIKTGTTKPGPDFYIVHMHKLWTWLTEVQIEIIIEYLSRYVHFLLIVYNNKSITADNRLIKDWVDNQISITYDRREKRKRMHYAHPNH